jgi:hypothetical protein
MKDYSTTVTLKCVFCESTFLKGGDSNLTDGSMVECGNCGEWNDFILIRDLAVNEEVKKIGENIRDSFMKNHFNFK